MLSASSKNNNHRATAASCCFCCFFSSFPPPRRPFVAATTATGTAPFANSSTRDAAAATAKRRRRQPKAKQRLRDDDDENDDERRQKLPTQHRETANNNNGDAVTIDRRRFLVSAGSGCLLLLTATTTAATLDSRASAATIASQASARTTTITTTTTASPTPSLFPPLLPLPQRQFETVGQVPKEYFQERKSIYAFVERVIDGDTIRVRHIPSYGWRRVLLAWSPARRNPVPLRQRGISDETLIVRIYGVDCPETAKRGGSRTGGGAAQPYADAAKQFASELGTSVSVCARARDYCAVVALTANAHCLLPLPFSHSNQ